MFRRLMISLRERSLCNSLYKEQGPFFWMVYRETSNTHTKSEIAMIEKLQEHCPTLIRTLRDAIETVSPKYLGILLSLIYRTSMGVALLMVQGPTESQLQAYCTKLYVFGLNHLDNNTTSPNGTLMPWRHEIPSEIAAFIHDYRTQHHLPTQIPGLFDAENRFTNACRAQSQTTISFLDTVLNEIRQSLHTKFDDHSRSTYSWLDMSSAYFKDQEKLQLIPDPDLRHFEAAMEEAHEDGSYIATGQRVALDVFCKPLSPLYVPLQGECVICSEKLADGGENQGCVVTKCAHYFHGVCLDTWVNEAAQRASNECPLCREELCEGRARVPV